MLGIPDNINIPVIINNTAKYKLKLRFTYLHYIFCIFLQESNTLLPWLPNHMMYMSPETKERFALDYDTNGDSYTKDVDVDSLKQIFERIDEQVKITYITQQLRHSFSG